MTLPETKPETEWVRGRPLQKVSPRRTHALLQGALTIALTRWAAGRGEVGPEWRFRIAPEGEARRPLVPDVAYVSNERLGPLSDAELEFPPISPDVAIEILSPDDRRIDVDDKISVYLRGGSSLVIVVDSGLRVVELHDGDGVTSLGEGDAIEHPALPGFSQSVRELFEELRRA
ncbi:MAG TPA: Uma2 family endonuclease [Candidatus Tumulicola sp.]